MASRTSNQAWSKGIDAGTVLTVHSNSRKGSQIRREIPKDLIGCEVDGRHPNNVLFVRK
jgi:hypothetical protein